MSFDWQTEEDGEWEEQTWQDKPETAVQAKPPWRTILIIVVLLSVVGVVVYQRANRRLDDATAAVESDIFASHNVLSRAAANQDGDLGKAVLSGRDMGWSQIQTDLIAAGLFYEPLGLGLTLANEGTAFAPLFREDERFVDLTLSPDLNGAELIYGRDYLAFTDDGLQPVTLQHTAVYRRGETRWLLSPPLDEFWGAWQTVEQDNITFIYPLRDEETVSRLSEDLPGILDEVCQELPELNCSPETAIQIRFDTDPESLLDVADPANLYKANLRLNLPTPTLVGLPIDNDGYQALRNAYATKLAAALISDSVAYDCCNHAPMFQAVMIYQLSELGLVHWPVTQEVQQTLANNGVHTEMLFPYWSGTDFSLINDENSYQLFGFVDFLLKQYVASATPMWLMVQMNTTSRAYQTWLIGLSPKGESIALSSADLISRDWWFFALTQAEILSTSAQPISLPAQDLQVGCLDPDFEKTIIYRFKLADESWVEEFNYDGLAFFNPLPHDDGVVLQLVEVSEEQYWQTLLWRDGASKEIMNTNDTYSISLGQMDPNGRFLLSYFGSEEDESLPEPLLIDMESCQDGNCDRTSLGQTPYWSPNGQQMLLTDLHLFDSGQYTVDGRIISLNPESFDQISSIWLRSAAADPQEAIKIDEGASPFWITDDLFGYIRPVSPSGVPSFQEVVVVSTTDLQPEPVIETMAIQAALPETNRSRNLIFRYAIAHPTNPDLFLLMASTQANDSYLFQVNRQTQAVQLLFPLDLSRGEHSLGFSPDGRYLAATGTVQQETTSTGFNNRSPFGALHLYNLENGEYQTILTNTDFFFPAFLFDWSLDGNWLAFARDNNVISFIALDYDYQQMIIHDKGNCTSLSWVNSLPTD